LMRQVFVVPEQRLQRDRCRISHGAMGHELT